MQYNDIYLIALLKASIYDKTPDFPTEAVDWQYIYNKSVEQNIAGLVYNALNKIIDKINIPSQLVEEWNKHTIASFMHSVKQFNEFKSVSSILTEKQIDFIGLKGCVLRSLYPVPELRTMGDFDILIKKEQLTAIKNIFSAKGYSAKNDYTGIIYSKNNIVWEVFFSLNEEFKINTDKWDKLFAEKTTEINSIVCPDFTLFFLHLIIHTGKHYITEGAGIRNLCDITLFLNKYKKKIDFDYIEETCREQGYYKLYCHIINAVNIWFDANVKGVDTIQTNIDGFVEYMLLNGIYGKHDNVMLSQLTKNENAGENTIRKLFFPSAGSLKYRYKYLMKMPFLLPIAWIHRFLSAIFRLNFSTRRMIKDTKGAIDYAKVRNTWLKKLDLID